MRTRAGQSGFTILGFLFVAAVVVTVAMVGFRVLPAYIEWFTVQKVLKATLDSSVQGETLLQFRHDFDLRSAADYIDSVRGSDVELSRQDNKLVASASWTRQLHMVGNASILLEFEAEASK